MSTTASTFKPHRSWDRIFFPFMALLILATVLYGFAHTYFLAGMVLAPLPSLLVHLHGAAFTLWILLLIVQIGFVTTHNVAIHRKLGVYGFLLAVVMVVLGFFTAIGQLNRGHVPRGMDPQTFFIIPLSALALFALFVYFAWRNRSKPESHKRLILIATISIIDAAVGRWPIDILQQHPPYQDLVLFAFLLLIILYDLASLHRITRTTLWCSLLYVVVHLTRVPLGFTPAWHHFASLFLHK